MIPCVRVKDGVSFAVIAPGGFRILAAFEDAADQIAHDLTITSGTDGAHSGPDDPHHRGEAYDIRTKDLPDKMLALAKIKDFLGIPDAEQQGSRFFAWIEDEGQENEHIHVQVRKGTVYPPAPLNTAPAVADALASD
jgi:hypothetical protein